MTNYQKSSALHDMIADMVRIGATNQAIIDKAKTLGVDEQTALRIILDVRRRPPGPTTKRTEKIKALAKSNKAGTQMMIYGVVMFLGGVMTLGFITFISVREWSLFPFIAAGLLLGGIILTIVGFFKWSQASK